MNKVLKIVFIILINILAYFIQFFVIGSKTLFGIKPNLILVTIIVVISYSGLVKGSILAMLNGIFLDILYSSENIGIYTIVYTLTATIAGILKENSKQGIYSTIYILVISCFLFEALQSLILLFVYKVSFSFILFVIRTVLFVILNLCIMVIEYAIFNKIYSLDKKYDMY